MKIEDTAHGPVPRSVPAGGPLGAGTAGAGLPRHATGTDADGTAGTAGPVPTVPSVLVPPVPPGPSDGTGTAVPTDGTAVPSVPSVGPAGTAGTRCTCRSVGTDRTGGTGTGTVDTRMIKVIDHGSMWPTSAIVGGFAAFGQHIFARGIHIPDPFAWLATGLFELVMISFLVRGWLRARKNLSPLVPWFVATAIGVVSIFVQLLHSKTMAEAVFFGVASGLVLLLWFTKLYDSYRSVLRSMGKIVTPIPKYGRMWILDFRRAWWGMRVGTAIQCDEIDVTSALAWTYIATNKTLKLRGVRADLRKITAWNAVYEQVGLPTIVLPTALMMAAVGIADPVPSVTAVPVPPVLEAGTEVSSVPSVPVPGPVVPAVPDCSPVGTAVPSVLVPQSGTDSPAVPSVPSVPGTAVPAGPDETDGTAVAAGTVRAPRPPTFARSVPVSPAPAGPKPPWTPNHDILAKTARLVDDLVAELIETKFAADPRIEEKDVRFFREDLVRLAVQTGKDNPERDTERWGAGDWLTNPNPATKDEIRDLCHRGGSHALKIGRIAKALRTVAPAQH